MHLAASHTPIRCTPGFLFKAISRQTMRDARPMGSTYSVQRHLANSARELYNSLEACLKEIHIYAFLLKVTILKYYRNGLGLILTIKIMQIQIYWFQFYSHKINNQLALWYIDWYSTKETIHCCIRTNCILLMSKYNRQSIEESRLLLRQT